MRLGRYLSYKINVILIDNGLVTSPMAGMKFTDTLKCSVYLNLQYYTYNIIYFIVYRVNNLSYIFKRKHPTINLT